MQLVKQQKPDLFKAKYQAIPWHQKRQQQTLRAELAKIIRASSTPERAIARVERFLKKLLHNHFFESAIARQLFRDLRDSVKSYRLQETPQRQQPLSALLLDAENIQLDAKTEATIAKACRHPLQIKIAFADWRQLGQLDRELHARGYDLVQVPKGRDHADGKMIAIGSSMQTYYANARTVFVCSSDTVMTSLCNHLQRSGLQTYRVSRQGHFFEVLDCQTHQTQMLAADREIPSQQELEAKLQSLIRQQQACDRSQWVALSRLEQAFQARHHLNLKRVVAYYNSQGSIGDFLHQFVENCVVYQKPNSSCLYVTLFQTTSPSPQSDPPQPNPPQKTSPPPQSAAQLKTALLNVLQSVLSHPDASSSGKCRAGTLAWEFRKQYGESITNALKRLDVGEKFVPFLNHIGDVRVRQIDNEQYVSLSSQPHADDADYRADLSALQSSADLEACLTAIVRRHTNAVEKSLAIEILGTEFYRQYQQGINQVLKQLNLRHPITQFLRESDRFQLVKGGNSYKVTTKRS